MERMGVCTKASSPWGSPLHLTQKTDGTWRPCGDYRRLSMATEPDHYPLPNIVDLTASIGQSRVFSKLDLLKCYFQVHCTTVSAMTLKRSTGDEGVFGGLED